MTAARRQADTVETAALSTSKSVEFEESEMQRSIVLRDATRFSEIESEAHALLARLREALDRCDDVRVARIARARTTLQVLVYAPDGSEFAGPVLFCDQPRPAVSMGGGPAEVTIHLTPDQARSFRAGRLQLSTALVAGEVRATGPARKFLVVEPIVRALLAACPDRTPGA